MAWVMSSLMMRCIAGVGTGSRSRWYATRSSFSARRAVLLIAASSVGLGSWGGWGGSYLTKSHHCSLVVSVRVSGSATLIRLPPHLHRRPTTRRRLPVERPLLSSRRRGTGHSAYPPRADRLPPGVPTCLDPWLLVPRAAVDSWHGVARARRSLHWRRRLRVRHRGRRRG